MADGVARVVVEADTSLADAAFKKLRADAERAMAAIGRQRAQAEVDAKTTGFDRKIDDVKRKIAQLDGTTANPNVDIDSAEAKAELALLKAELKKLGSEKATLRVDAKELRDANKLRDISAKKQAAMSKAYLDEGRAIDRATKARERAEAVATRQAASEERAIRKMAQLQSRAAEEDIERTGRLARARRDYGKVLGELQRLENKTGRPGGLFRTGAESRDLEVARTKAEALAREVEKLGGSISDIDPDLERNQGLLGRWGSSLSKVRVQMGFFSATAAQMAKGIFALGPLLTGLGGGLISIVGVLGSGIAGAGAVGAAGLAGFIGAAAGVIGVVHPLVKQFEEASKASEKVAKAEKEYGKNSTQAKTATEKFNKIMANTSPAAKAAVRDYGNLKDRWKELTAAARPAVFEAFGQGLRTVQALLPGFAKQSVDTTKTAAHAWDGWMKSLRSPEAKQLLNTVLSNFRSSIPGVADGLASLSAAFGRIAAAASKTLPSLSKGFADWANKVEAAVGGGDALDKKISNMVSNMKDLGHLTSDTGSLLLHIFGASSKSGDDLVNSLDDVIQRWDKWASSTQGKASLKNFFGEAREETEQFFSALSPLTRLLFAMSRAFAPITSGALKVVSAVGNMVTELTKIPGLKVGLEAVGGVLASMWAVGKIRMFAGAIGDAAGALRGLFAAEGAGGGLSALLGLGGGARAAAGAAALEREGEAVIGVGTAAATTGESVGLFSALLAPEVLVPAAGLAALVVLATTLEGPKSGFEEAGEAARDAGKNFHTAVTGFVQDGAKYSKTLNKEATINAQAKTAREQLVAAQKKYGVVSKEALAAQERLNNVEKKQTVTAYQAGRQRTQSVNQAKAAASAANEEVRAREKQIHAAKEANQSIARGENLNTAFGNPHEAEQVAFAVHKLTLARKEAAQAAAQMTIANIPLQRQQKEMLPLTQQTVQGLKHLSQTIGAAATRKIGNFVKPQDVAEITKLGNKLEKLGRGQQVKQIAVKSSGAEQTTAKLKQLQRQTAKVEGARATVKVNANDTGAQRTLKAVSRESQRLAGTKATVRILANSDNAEQAINRLVGHLHAVINKSYKAELKAEDKSGAAAASFHHNLERPATQKYEAKLTAVDRASNVAKQAESAAKRAANGQYQAKLTAVNQAQGVIQGAIAELNAYDGRTATSTITTRHVTVNESRGGKYMGGRSSYTMAFAAGGIPTDAEIERARVQAERSTMRDGTRGARVTRPTMLVGEQAPRYNEYVITENPAYRSNNERYLEEAANGMGMSVASYKRGRGGNKRHKRDGGQKQDNHEDLYPKKNPPPEQHKEHRIVKVTRWGPVQTINRNEQDIQVLEHKYNAERQREEQDIQKDVNQGKRGHWNWDLLKSYLNKEKQDYQAIESAIPKVKSRLAHEQTRLTHLLDGNGKFSKNKEEQVRKHVVDLEHEKDGLKAPHKPSKGNMTEAQYKAATQKYEDKKQRYEKHKAKLEAKIKAEKNREKHIQKERARLESIREEANQEERELTQSTTEETETSRKEVETSIEALAAEESGELEPSYPTAQEEPEEEEKPIERAEAEVMEAELLGPSGAGKLKEAREHLLGVAEGELAKAKQTPQASDDIEALQEIKSAKEALEEDTQGGGTAKSIGEETSSLSGARQSLYEQFASNITSARPSGPTPFGGYPAGAIPNSTNDLVRELAASNTMGGGFAVGPTPVGQQGIGSTKPNSGGTVMNVTNNFSTPPPDPHTFSKNLTFELNAG